MVYVEGRLHHAAARFPRNWWFTWLEKCIRARRRRIPNPDIPLKFRVFSVRGRCARNLSLQTSRRFTASVVNPVQPSVLKQSLAGTRIGLLSPLDHHPGYTIDAEGHQQGCHIW